MKPTDIVIAPEPGQLFAGIPPGVALDQADGFGIIGLSLEIIEQFFIILRYSRLQMTQRPQPPGFIFQSFLQHQVYPAGRSGHTTLLFRGSSRYGQYGIPGLWGCFSVAKSRASPAMRHTSTAWSTRFPLFRSTCP